MWFVVSLILGLQQRGFTVHISPETLTGVVGPKIVIAMEDLRWAVRYKICMYTGVRNFNLVVAKADQPPNIIFHLSGYNIIILLFFPIDLPSPIMLLAYRRKTLYKAYEDVNSGLSRGEKLGVPQYFGIYYAIGELSPRAPFII